VTHQSIQKDVETSSRIYLRELHNSIELERGNFKTMVLIPFTIDVGKLFVEIMLFQSIG
jgi:hypothetical protein